jgi:hypothetical protein
MSRYPVVFDRDPLFPTGLEEFNAPLHGLGTLVALKRE